MEALESRDVIAYAAQLSVSCVFLAACVLKLRDIGAFRRTFANYAILPQSVAVAAAPLLAVSEGVVAVALTTGFAFQAAVVFALTMLASFAVGISTNLYRKRTIACGCFGGTSDTISIRSLIRLALISLPLIALLRLGESRLTAQMFTETDAVASRHLVEASVLSVSLLICGAWLLALPEALKITRPIFNPGSERA